jgi:hypothetical protein
MLLPMSRSEARLLSPSGTLRRVEILSFPRNFGKSLPDYTASQTRRREFSVTGVKNEKPGFKIVVSERTTFR